MVIGDSLVSGYNLQEEDAYPYVLEDKLYELGYNIEINNAGVSGDTTSGGLTRLRWLLGEQPDFLILELGSNDMIRGIPPKETNLNLEEMLQIAQDRNIPTLLIGMKSYRNLGIDFFDPYVKIFKNLAEKYKTPLYPFFLEGVFGEKHLMQIDGVHPNNEGVKIMVEKTLPLVLEFLGPLSSDEKKILEAEKEEAEKEEAEKEANNKE